MVAPKGNPGLVILPPAVVLGVLLWEVIPWMLGQPGRSVSLLALSVVSGIIWLVVLWWALHQLVFQLAALFPVKHCLPPDAPCEPVRLLVLYLTRDDFLARCCQSCVDQDYPRDAFQVAVCDDSRSEDYQTQVDNFCEANPGLLPVRRTDKSGYKAGNLNHAFHEVAEDKCDWVVIVDADQILPRSFLVDLARFIALQPPEVAFVQAGRDPLPQNSPMEDDPVSDALQNTPFQSALQADIRIFHERDMCLRGRFGFLPFLGHGGAIRQTAWKHIGGFPLVVSEDYGFTMVAREFGFKGERVDQVRSWESYPKDFGAFVVRLSKFARGAAELLRHCLPRFLRSKVSFSEKVDAIMLLASYLLMPLAICNLAISAYLSRSLWTEGLSVLAPKLPYVFLGLFLLSFPILLSVNPVPMHAVRHWFWAFAVYTSALPVAAANFVLYLFKKPSFECTPKAGQLSPRYAMVSVAVCTTGFIGLFLAWYWWSPFSPILAASATSFASFPIYRWLHEESSWRGRLGRTLVYLPGCLFIAGIFTMWLSATS